MKRYWGQTKLDVYFICRLVYLLCRLVSLWLFLVYFGDILKYRLDPELDFGFWEKKLLWNHPPPATFEASKSELSYDYVVIEGYRTRTKNSYGKLSLINLQ